MPGKSQSLKGTVISFLENDGDWEAIKKNHKGSLTLHCYLDNPQFILSDGKSFLGAYLTKQAFDSFRKTSKVKLTEAQGQKFEVSKWELELVRVDSANVYTSYCGLEVRLVVHEIKTSTAKMDVSHFLDNIHRDNDVKSHIARINLESVRESTEVLKVNFAKFDEKKTKGVSKEVVQELGVDTWEETAVLTMRDILKKETPSANLKPFETTEEPSTFSKKRQDKEDRKKEKRTPSQIRK